VGGPGGRPNNPDSLAGFCGTKTDHVCVSNYKVIIDSGKLGYNKVVDAFQTNKVGGFAKVVMVNPLHDKVPCLVLAVCCACDCFDSEWVQRQWDTIDTLWRQECEAMVGPINR
jgi:hypothetical protein